MGRQRRRAAQVEASSGRGALISSATVLALLLAYQCSDEGAQDGTIMKQLVTPSSLSLPKSATSKTSP